MTVVRGLTGYEREFILNHTFGDAHAYVESFSRKWSRQVRRVVARHADHSSLSRDVKHPYASIEAAKLMGASRRVVVDWVALRIDVAELIASTLAADAGQRIGHVAQFSGFGRLHRVVC